MHRSAGRGLEAIAAFWDVEREGPDEVFTVEAEMVATDVDGLTGVARLEVRYGEPSTRTYRDLWIIELDEHGRCTAFEEWPFFPGKARARPDAGRVVSAVPTCRG